MTIKCYHSDSGGEFMNKQFIELFQKSGIIHQLPYPYTLPQNGIAEQKHCHLIETSVMLIQTVLTATYLINRLPSSTL